MGSNKSRAVTRNLQTDDEVQGQQRCRCPQILTKYRQIPACLGQPSGRAIRSMIRGWAEVAQPESTVSLKLATPCDSQSSPNINSR